MTPLMKVRYLVRQKDGLYRYQRRVPEFAQEALGRKTWNLSVGRDVDEAVRSVGRYRDRHDALLASLKNPETQARERLKTAERRTSKRIYELKQANAPTYASTEELAALGVTEDEAYAEEEQASNVDATTLMSEVWQQTPRYLSEYHGHSEEDVWLTNHMNIAFTAERPTDPVDSALWEAYQSLLKSRLKELGVRAPVEPKHKLSYLRDEYSRLNGSAPGTIRTRNSKIRRLIQHIGDLAVTEYTPDLLNQHRDYLLEEGLSPTSVGAYLDATRAILNWSIKYQLVPGLTTNPVNLVMKPKAEDTIEDRKWNRFDEKEIKRVWSAVKDAWGPDAQSKLSKDRRAAFLMVFRVLLYTGLRPFEVFALRTEGKVTPKTIVIEKSKTKAGRRTLPLSKHIADFYPFWRNGGLSCCDKKDISGVMSESFTKIIRAAGLTDSRHVLYSTKDTLVDRLQRQPGASDDILRGFTGHVSGQGHLRNYKTRLNDSPGGLDIMRNSIDQITYW